LSSTLTQRCYNTHMISDKDRRVLREKQYFGIAVVARILGVRRSTAKVWLLKHNALNEDGKCSKELLKKAFPDVYNEIIDELYDSNDDFSDVK
jgi:hypothetical protein